MVVLIEDRSLDPAPIADKRVAQRPSHDALSAVEITIGELDD